MGRRAMTLAEIREYAWDRIETARTKVHYHRLVSPELCSCGRAWPCADKRSLTAEIDHYQDRLARMEAEAAAVPVLSRPVTILGILRGEAPLLDVLRENAARLGAKS